MSRALTAKLLNLELSIRVAHTVIIDMSMLWKDTAFGCLIAGRLG